MKYYIKLSYQHRYRSTHSKLLNLSKSCSKVRSSVFATHCTVDITAAISEIHGVTPPTIYLTDVSSTNFSVNVSTMQLSSGVWGRHMYVHASTWYLKFNVFCLTTVGIMWQRKDFTELPHFTVHVQHRPYACCLTLSSQRYRYMGEIVSSSGQEQIDALVAYYGSVM